MATPIRMPQPGQMTEECTIVHWFKSEGDAIARGEPLFEIETDKSNMEVEAFENGVLLRVLVAEGQTVPVETVVAWIGQPGEAISETVPTPPVPAPAGPAIPLTPASPPPAQRMATSPRAARLAAELGVDLRPVTGSGPGGRIVERDVRAASAHERGSQPRAEAASASAAKHPDDSGEGQPLSRLRQVIARRLTESVTMIPQFSVTVAADLTGLVAMRAEMRAAGSPLTLTDLIHAATVQTLVEFPLVNSLTDGQALWLRERVHLGIAVSVPGGLLVPVIRDAHVLDVAGLHERAAALIQAARAGRSQPDELTGSTFTVSNLGMHGIESFTAIINPGESGILAVSSVRPEAVAHGGGLAVRHMMRLTLSADHRIVDGELGARFLNGVRRRLEDAEAFRATLLSD